MGNLMQVTFRIAGALFALTIIGLPLTLLCFVCAYLDELVELQRGGKR